MNWPRRSLFSFEKNQWYSFVCTVRRSDGYGSLL